VRAVDGSGSFRKLSSITRLFFIPQHIIVLLLSFFKVVKIDACY